MIDQDALDTALAAAEAAREDIAAGMWMKGDFGDSWPAHKCLCFCALGAFYAELGLNQWGVSGHDLATAKAGALFKSAISNAAAGLSGDTLGAIAYNDSPRTTRRDVVEMLDYAIEMMEERVEA